MGRPRLQLAGEIFGRLTVLEFHKIGVNRHAYWRCVCSCGRITTVLGFQLKRGNSTSCGCLRIDRASEAHKQQNVVAHGRLEKLHTMHKGFE